MGTETLEKPREIGKRMMIAVADIMPNPANRKVTGDDDIKSMAQTIKVVGLLHPLIVRRHPEEEGRYRLIAGERRWRALRQLKIEKAPCLVVAGPGLGRLKWIQLPKDSGSRSSSAHAAEENDGVEAGGEKTPEQKREPYDRRRRQVVIDAVKARLGALANAQTSAEAAVLEGGEALCGKGMTAKTILLLHTLLSDWGWTEDIHRLALELPEETPWETLGKLPNHGLGSEETRDHLMRMIWTLMRLCLATLMKRVALAPHELTNEAQYREAELLCRLLHLDLGALRAEAAGQIPYAKSWRGEVADEWMQPEADIEGG